MIVVMLSLLHGKKSCCVCEEIIMDTGRKKQAAAFCEGINFVKDCFTGPVLDYQYQLFRRYVYVMYIEDPFYCNFCLVSSKTNRSKHCKLGLPPYQTASYAQITSEQSSQLTCRNNP